MLRTVLAAVAASLITVSAFAQDSTNPSVEPPATTPSDLLLRLRDRGVEIPVDFLRVGRVGLLYKTRDAEEYGVWNQADKTWETLDKSDYANWIDEGLRVAKKQAAPQLIRVPLPQPIQGGQS